MRKQSKPDFYQKYKQIFSGGETDLGSTAWSQYWSSSRSGRRRSWCGRSWGTTWRPRKYFKNISKSNPWILFDGYDPTPTTWITYGFSLKSSIRLTWWWPRTPAQGDWRGNRQKDNRASPGRSGMMSKKYDLKTIPEKFLNLIFLLHILTCSLSNKAPSSQSSPKKMAVVKPSHHKTAEQQATDRDCALLYCNLVCVCVSLHTKKKRNKKTLL